MFSFKGWIFKKFPLRVKQTDPNKDSVGRGTWERYVKNFEDELDAEVYPFIRDFMEIFDIIKTDEKFLPYLSYYLGSPPSVTNDIDTYRKVLSYATQLYRIKGTIKSFQLLFNLYGLDITIKEATPLKAANYDTGIIYDSDPVNLYDQQCEYCTCYWITYKEVGQPDNNTAATDLSVPAEMIELINKIICFIQPINAKLCGVYRKLTFADELELNFEDTPGLSIADRIKFMQLFADLGEEPSYPQLENTYTTENQRELDLDIIYDNALDSITKTARFYFANESEIVNSFVVHDIPVMDKSSFVNFIRYKFYSVTQNESLEITPDFIYILNPEGPVAFYGLHIFEESELATLEINLKNLEGINHPDCPDIVFPVLVYAVDNTIVGVANTKEEIAQMWNDYTPNKDFGVVEYVSGCTYVVTFHPSVNPPTGITINTIETGDEEPGDFNNDFDDDFYN